jgi:hypothetical protein
MSTPMPWFNCSNNGSNKWTRTLSGGSKTNTGCGNTRLFCRTTMTTHTRQARARDLDTVTTCSSVLMIGHERFLARSSNRAAWLAARAGGVTATAVAKAATPAGFRDQLAEILNPTEVVDNDYMRFGRDNEPWIADWIKNDSGIMPNEWLIESFYAPRFMATPDGLSLDHLSIAEIKTGGDEKYVTPPRKYRDQMQWQMFCTGTEICCYAFMLRTADFQCAWVDPCTTWVGRDDTRIKFLIDVAERLIEGQDNARS